MGLVIGLCAGIALGKLLAELALLYYGNLSRNPLGLYGTTILTTNLVFIALIGGALAVIGWKIGRRTNDKEVLRLLAQRGPLWMGRFAGCLAGLFIAWLSRGLVEHYLWWRIPVDEEGFAPIRVALPAFQLLFAVLLCALFGLEGRRFAHGSFGMIKPLHRAAWAWPVRLIVSLAVAAVGVEFAFDVGAGLVRPLGEFLRPLAHPEDNLRWLLVLSWGVIASILAIPLALGGQAVGRWLSFGLALIGLRVGMHAGELSALLVWDYYDERAQSFDDLSVVYMSARLGLGVFSLRCSPAWGSGWGRSWNHAYPARALTAMRQPLLRHPDLDPVHQCSARKTSTSRVPAVSSSRPIVASSAMVSSWAGAMVGAHIADVIQAQHYNDPEWAALDPGFMILFGALFARAGFELGRWFVAVRTGMYLVPAGWAGFFVYARALVRVAAAAIGLRLGFEAGWWTAFFWDQWGSTAQFVGEAHVEFSDVWIITGSLWGGALGLFGFKIGRRFPVGVAFLAAYLALDAVRHVAPRVADLYWGGYTSSDQVAVVWWVADLISIGILVPCFAAVAYWSARSLIVACTTAGFASGAALGAWIGFEIQAFYYNDLEWRALEEVLFFLLGGLGALAGRELGRWVAELRAGLCPLPSGRDWPLLLSGALLRIALAAVGLWLGVEIGYWLALLWDEYASAAPFAYDEIALVWIIAGSASGGTLAVLGYRFGGRPPVAVTLLGALLAFAIAPHLAPMQEHLYWGPFPSSDVHAGLWRRSLLVTGALAAVLSLLGYVSARLLHWRGATGTP